MKKYSYKIKIYAFVILLLFGIQMFSLLGTTPEASENRTYFFIDDFSNADYTLEKWKGTFYRKNIGSKLIIYEDNVAWTTEFSINRDASSELWLSAREIDITKITKRTKLQIIDANTSRILYSLSTYNFSTSSFNLQLPSYLFIGSEFVRIKIIGYLEIGEIKFYTPNRYYHDFLTDGQTFNHPSVTEDAWGYTKTVTVPLGSKIKLESPTIFIPYKPEVNLSYWIQVDNSQDNVLYNFSYSLEIVDVSTMETITLDGDEIYYQYYPGVNTLSLLDYCGFYLKFKITLHSLDFANTEYQDLMLRFLFFNIYTRSSEEPVDGEFSPWDYIHASSHTYFDVAKFFDNYYASLAIDREGYVATYFVENEKLLYTDFLKKELLIDNYTINNVDYINDNIFSGVTINSKDICAYRKDFSVNDFAATLVFNVSSYNMIAGIVLSGYSTLKVGIGKTNDKPAIFIYENDLLTEIIFLKNEYDLLVDNSLSIETAFGLFSYKIQFNEEEYYYQPSIGFTFGGNIGFFSKSEKHQADEIAEFKSISVFGPTKQDSNRLLLLVKSQQNIKIQLSHLIFNQDGSSSEEILGIQDVKKNQDTIIHFKTHNLKRLEYLFVTILNDDSISLRTPVYFGPLLFSGTLEYNTKINPVNYYDKGESTKITGDTLVHTYTSSANDDFIASYDINIREPCLFEIGVYVDNILPRISVDIYSRKMYSGEPFEFQGTITWTENEEEVFGHVVFLDLSEGDYEIMLKHPFDAYNTTKIHYIQTRPIGKNAMAYSDYTNHDLGSVWQLDFNTQEGYLDDSYDLWEEEYYYTLHNPSVDYLDTDSDGVLELVSDWDDVSNAQIFVKEGNIAAFSGSVSLENLNIPIDHLHYPYIYFEIYYCHSPSLTEVTFEDNNGIVKTFNIFPENNLATSTPKSFILANIFGINNNGQVIEGQGGNPSSLKLMKITFNSRVDIDDSPIIVKNIQVYRIAKVETYDSPDYSFAPYVSNNLFNFSPFYVQRYDELTVQNSHNVYSKVEPLKNYLNKNDFALSLSDLDWFLNNQEGLKPIFISQSEQQDWKLNPKDMLNYYTSVYSFSNQSFLPGYLSPAATKLQIMFSVSNDSSSLIRNPRDNEILLELQFIDPLRHLFKDAGAGYRYLYGTGYTFSPYIGTGEDLYYPNGNNYYYITLKGTYKKPSNASSNFDAIIEWTIDDQWSSFVLGDSSYSILPFTESYINFDEEYTITIDYGRPYYFNDADGRGNYSHNFPYTSLFDYPDEINVQLSKTRSGYFKGFTVYFNDNVLLGGEKEDPDANGGGDVPSTRIQNLNKYPLFTQTCLSLGAAPLSYDLNWELDTDLYPNYDKQPTSLLSFADIDIASPAIKQIIKDDIHIGNFLYLPSGSKIEIFSNSTPISNYYCSLGFGEGTLTLETNTEGWDGKIGEHYLSNLNYFIESKITNSTKPELSVAIFDSSRKFYYHNQHIGYSSAIDKLKITYHDYTPSSLLSLDVEGAISGDWELLAQSSKDSTTNKALTTGADGLRWQYLNSYSEAWEQDSFYHNINDLYYGYRWLQTTISTNNEYNSGIQYHWVDLLRLFSQRGLPKDEVVDKVSGYAFTQFDDTDYETDQSILPKDDIPLRIINYQGQISNKFLLRAQFKIEKWHTEDLPSAVWLTTGALILPQKRVIRISVLHVGYLEDFDYTKKYISADCITPLAHQEISYVFIGNSLLGAFSNDQEVLLDFEILVEKPPVSSELNKYIVNIRCDTPTYTEGLSWWYKWERLYPVIETFYTHINLQLPLNRIMENTNFHTEFLDGTSSSIYGYIYTENGTWTSQHGDHKVAFLPLRYLTEEEEYCINSAFDNESFAFGSSFGSDLFTYC
ncbi:MAG: hypothetical protein ACTSP3_02640 [Candidatus Heimdallarchaeaceae archaeon]